MRITIYSFLLGITVLSCTTQEPFFQPTSVEKYLTNMMDIMEENFINKSDIDWVAFKASVLQNASGTTGIANAESSILFALELLNDQSTFIISATGKLITLNTVCTDDEAPAVADDPDIGYIHIPAFSKVGFEAAIFSESKHNEARVQDKEDLKGWIVDLRGNVGGNLWPMIAAVGPILGEGLLGYFVDNNSKKSPFTYNSGSAIYNENLIVTVLLPYTILSPDAKVAVLVDHATSNAGQVVAIAFSGKANTKSFGDITCGSGGGNQTFMLLDGSRLFLNVAFLSDRNDKEFKEALKPDVLVSDPNLVYDKAVEWINE